MLIYPTVSKEVTNAAIPEPYCFVPVIFAGKGACTRHSFMRNELRLDYRFVFIADFIAFHCAQTGLWASLIFFGNMRHNLIRFSVELHTHFLMTGSPAWLPIALFPETFGGGFVESVVGWWR